MSNNTLKTWVEYKPGSPVQQANIMVAGLRKEGHENLILLSQGAEETEPDANREIQVQFSSGYQKAVGGTLEQRGIAAGFLNHFLGYGVANRENTFIIMNNGRNGLDAAFKIAAGPFVEKQISPSYVVGDLSWPMVADLARDQYYSKTLFYGLSKDGLTAEIKKNRDLWKTDLANMAAFYTNYPNNPTGLHGSREDMVGLYAFTDQINRERKGGPPLVHIADNPYFAGLPQQSHGSALSSAYENVATLDGDTPTVFVTSLAKAEGFATPGVHLMTISDSKMAEEYKLRLKRTYGFSYFPGAMQQVTAQLHPDNYQNLSNHFGKLAAKYGQNYRYVEENLGDYLLDSNPNMVVTIELPSEALNKMITCSDGNRRLIQSARQVAEYIANEHGVITVDQSVGDRQLLRLALKGEDHDQVERGVKLISGTINELRIA